MVRWPWSKKVSAELEALPPEDPNAPQRCRCVCHFAPHPACPVGSCCGACLKCAVLYVRADLERHEASCTDPYRNPQQHKKRKGEAEDGNEQAHRLGVHRWRLGPPRLCGCICHSGLGAIHYMPCCGACPKCERNFRNGLDEHVRECQAPPTSLEWQLAERPPQ